MEHKFMSLLGSWNILQKIPVNKKQSLSNVKYSDRKLKT